MQASIDVIMNCLDLALSDTCELPHQATAWCTEDALQQKALQGMIW